jgi:hypothetical protein
MKISELTYDDVVKILGTDEFHIHTDEEDGQLEIRNTVLWNSARTRLMNKFGDVEISLHPDGEWFDKIRIEDDGWKDAHKKFQDEKQAWCDKYGCD